MKASDIFRRQKNNIKDEFFACYEDIENLMICYKKEFKDKSICLPCDFGNFSEFWNYFRDNFDDFGLRRLDCFGRNPAAPASGVHGVITRGDDGRSGFASFEYGPEFNDFRSPVVSMYAAESDIIITNPPFSLFRAFLEKIQSLNKKFIIVGNLNAVTYKQNHETIKKGNLCIISQHDFNIKKFKISGNEEFVKFGFARWFTNFNYPVKRLPMKLTALYNPEYHKKYDNYNAINCDKIKDIPRDYIGEIGVPITFIDFYDPNQFDIIGFFSDYSPEYQGPGDVQSIGVRVSDRNSLYYGPVVNGIMKYHRMIIKRRGAK